MANKGYFLWNDTKSTVMGVVVTAQPNIYRPAERILATKAVLGRSGKLTITEGDMVYDDFTVAVPCMVQDSTLIPEISQWLHGAGRLVLGNYDEGYYNARVTNQIPFTQIMRGRDNRSFTVNFLCHPFMYLTIGDETTAYDESGVTLINPGTIYSEPYITVYGSGDISLTIADRTLDIAGVDGNIVIDNDAKLAYKGSVNMCGAVSGDDWLIIPPGESTLSWEGSVSSVEIMPRWRVL